MDPDSQLLRRGGAEAMRTVFAHQGEMIDAYSELFGP